MSKRRTKPIDLKALAADATRARTDMSAHLEGTAPARRSRTRRALWTQEFLASGKIGKLRGAH
jgi:hypothetical protein